MSTHADQPVHPHPGCASGGCLTPPQPGLTLRQYYAGVALQGLLASQRSDFKDDYTNHPSLLANALDLADAMIMTLAMAEDLEKELAELAADNPQPEEEMEGPAA